MGHNLLVNKIDAILKNISNYLLQCWARGWQYLQIDVNCNSLDTMQCSDLYDDSDNGLDRHDEHRHVALLRGHPHPVPGDI